MSDLTALRSFRRLFTALLVLAFACLATESAPAGELGQTGQWLPPMEWPVIGIHAAMLPSGKVLHYSYPFYGIGSEATTWNPITGEFGNVQFPKGDIFCSGLSFLSNGSLLTSGGNLYPSACGEFPQGMNWTHTFDPIRETWHRGPDMSVARWYPSNLTTGNGEVYIFAGIDDQCGFTDVMERYVNGGALAVVPEGARLLDLFPRLHQLSSGKFAHVGPEADTYTFDPVAGLWEYVASTNYGYRGEGTSVLLVPDVAMVMGGTRNDFPTRTCEIIDFNDHAPAWRFTTRMHFPRFHHTATLLPDGTVLVVGGNLLGTYDDPVLAPELFDPMTETWVELPPQVYARAYHSTAVLLPDGRVLSAGQDSGPGMFTAEIYEPGYLFRGPRPAITSFPREIVYGETFTIETPQDADIASVCLMGLTAATHSTNSNQRYVPLTFSAGIVPGSLLAQAPLNGNWAPPGYYMLFVVNSPGVPSEAAILHLDTSPASSVRTPESAGTSALWVRASPNPAAQQTDLQFALPSQGEARLRVVDTTGREVREFIVGTRSAGTHAVGWDGRDNAGRDLPSGHYFVVLTTAAGQVAEKLILAR